MSTTNDTDVPGLVFAPAPDAPDTANILLYGPPGSGKSTAAATAPGPILWVNCEGPGALGYARKIANARGTEILEVRINPKTPNVKQVLSQIMRHLNADADGAPKTVVIDTLGKLRELLIGQLVQIGSKNSLQQFGEVARAIGDLVVWLRDRDVNVILLAHEDVADVDGDRIVRPAIGGKLTETIPADMDLVAFCGRSVADDSTVSYMGQLVERNGRQAKDRSGGLGTVRLLDMSEWLIAYRDALTPDDADLPWVEGEAADTDDEPDTPGGQFDMDDARAA